MKKGNLLIVDDEPYIVENLVILLRQHADKIFTALNGREALVILLKEEIHCVICDIKMPLMNGVELIKEMRQRKSDVPFIFYTGHGNIGLMKEAALYGAFDFLDKPELDDLFNVVTLGLKKGFERNNQKSEWEALETEYVKMLKDL